VLAALGIAALGLGAQFTAAYLYGVPAPRLPNLAQWPALLTTGLIMFFPGPIGEELGWQGFALPRLMERWGGLTAAIVIGVVWGAWHLPAFIVQGMPQTQFPLWAFMVSVVSVSIVITWIVGKAQGSVLPAIVGHWSFNCFTNAHAPTAPISAAFFATAAVLVILLGGRIGAKTAA